MTFEYLVEFIAPVIRLLSKGVIWQNYFNFFENKLLANNVSFVFIVTVLNVTKFTKLRIY